MTDRPDFKKSDLSKLLKAADGALIEDGRPTDLAWHRTGTTVFDCATANGHDVVGGFPAGRTVELYGNESSGKTTLALQAAVDLQKHGRLIVYLDFERSFHDGYAKSLGLDTTDFREGGLFWLVEPEHVEQGFEIMEQVCTTDPFKDWVGMFIIDSVAAMESVHAQEDKEKHERIGLIAAAMSRLLRGFVRKLKKTNAVAIFINQTRMNPGAGPFGDPNTTPGGKALKFYASLRIALARGFKISTPVLNPLTGEREKAAVGHWVKVKIKKNKVSGEFYRDIELPILDNLGADNVMSCIEVGKKLGLVTGSTWLEVAPEVAGSAEKVRGQGIFGLRQQLVANDQVRDTFVGNVEAALRENFKQLQRDRESGRGLDLAAEQGLDSSADGDGSDDE